MPTYEYQCKKCKKHHEISQSITAKPLKKCPRKGCEGKLVRLMGTGGTLLFKGSGFYITDYRSNKYKEAKKKDQASSSPPPASSSDKASDSAKKK